MKTLLLAGIIFCNEFLNAQTKGDSTSNPLKTNEYKVSFKKPDSNFITLSGGAGYTLAAMNATINGSLFPGNYQVAEAELKRIKSSAQLKLVDTLHHLLGPKHAFTIIQEQGDSPNNISGEYILVTTIIPHNRHATFMVVGIYPKAHDNYLRKKFIEASLTIKVE